MNFYRRAKQTLIVLLIVCLIFSLSQMSVFSAVTTQQLSLPDVSKERYQVEPIGNDNGGYIEPTNSYEDGNPNYYLLTQDSGKASISTVSYEGKTFLLSNVFVSSEISGAKDAIKPNSTLFIDDGTYNSGLDYADLGSKNFSLVGLNKASNGEPSTILKRTMLVNNKASQYRFIHPDLYIGNVILDGDGKNMYNQTARGQYAVVIAQPADNFVMKDVIIQNVGASTNESWGTPNKNSALQIQYGQNGTHHIIGLVVRNIKTTNFGSGVVFTNQSNKNYFKDLTVDASSASSNTHGVRIENSDTSQMSDLRKNSAIFAGSIDISTGFIQVQDYRYEHIVVPDEYRYIEYRNTSSNQANLGNYRIYKNIPNSDKNKAILDRKDNFWVVRKDSSVPVNDQISAIASVRSFMAGVNNTTIDPSRIPLPNIKLVSNDHEIESFNVANFGSNVPVNIVAVKSIDANGSSEKSLVPVKTDFISNLGTTDGFSNVKLFNFDFAEKANYTLHEAINGLDPTSVTISDPQNINYPPSKMLKYDEYAKKQSPKITGKTGETILPVAFSNCKFVSLASGSNTTPTTLNVTASKTEINLDETSTITATFPSSYTNSTVPNSPVADTGADDKTIFYMSSDTSIATVDQYSGVVTPKTEGLVTIYAKAVDALNDGEIEKPYGAIEIKINKLPNTAKLTLSGSKTLLDKNGQPIDVKENQFTFSLIPDKGDITGYSFTPGDKAVDSNGTFRFNDITFTKAGEYTFIATENNLGVAYYTYDDEAVTIAVTVTYDKNKNILTINDPTYEKGGVPTNGITFVNTYEQPLTPEPLSLKFNISKVLKGAVLDAGRFNFTCSITNVTNSAMSNLVGKSYTSSNTADGQIVFSPDVGNLDNFATGDAITFEIKENNDGQKDIIFDSSTITVNAEKIDSGYDIKYYDNNMNLTSSPKFINKCTGTITVKNTFLENSEIPTSDFIFTVTLSDNTIDGIYDDMTFVNGVATLRLKANESKTATGLPADARYSIIKSDNNGYTATVDNTNETTATGSIVANSTIIINFNINKHDDGNSGDGSGGNSGGNSGDGSGYKPTPVVVKLNAIKIFDGKSLIDNSFTFNLKDEKGNIIQTKNNNNSNISFDALSFSAEGSYVYYITEKAGDDTNINYDDSSYKVTINVTLSGNYKASVSYEKNGLYYNDTPIFTNNTKISTNNTVSVSKIWDDNNTLKRPTSTTVQLYKDSIAHGNPIILSADNGWYFRWDDLDESALWTVDEVNVPNGYKKTITHSGDNWIITNKLDNSIEAPTQNPDNSPTKPNKHRHSDAVPKTGDSTNIGLWLAIMFLSLVGLTITNIFESKRKHTK